jgi:hypothetical protein
MLLVTVVQRIKQQPPSEQQQMRELVEMLQQAHRCGDVSYCGVH